MHYVWIHFTYPALIGAISMFIHQIILESNTSRLRKAALISGLAGMTANSVILKMLDNDQCHEAIRKHCSYASVILAGASAGLGVIGTSLWLTHITPPQRPTATPQFFTHPNRTPHNRPDGEIASAEVTHSITS